MSVRILVGDARQKMSEVADGSVDTCVSSPPYFGLRSYGHDDQIGQEPSPEAFVDELVTVFREVRRTLKDTGVLWLNLGDSYAGSGRGGNPPGGDSKQNTNAGSVAVGDYAHLHASADSAGAIGRKWVRPPDGYKQKDLIGVPWMTAFALRADGWYLRQWLPWTKRNPMPESTRDRPTSACEIVFMLTKERTYYYDYEGVRRRMAPSSVTRLEQDVAGLAGSHRANGGAKTNGAMKAVRASDKQRGHSRRHAGFNDRWDQMERSDQIADGRAFRNTDLFFDSVDAPHGAIANSDGEIIALDVPPSGYKGAHFATFPSALVEPLIRATTPQGGVVLDPFFGAGTTGLVADRLGFDCIGIELNPAYAAMAAERIRSDASMLADVVLEAA